jgi:hypothetical protein
MGLLFVIVMGTEHESTEHERCFCVFEKSNSFSKAQGTLEYIIIIAIVVVVALVVVGLLTGFFDTGSGVSLSQNKLFWASQSLGVEDAGVDGSGNSFFVVTNNTGENITLNGYRANGVFREFSGVLPTIASGGKKVVFVARQDACEGVFCVFDDFAFSYTTRYGLDRFSSGNDLVVEKQESVSYAMFSSPTSLICVNQNEVGVCGEASGLPSCSEGEYLVYSSGDWVCDSVSFSGGFDGNVYSLGLLNDSNVLLIDLDGGGMSLFGFVDGNFSGDVLVEGDLILDGSVKRKSCPSGYVLVPGDSNFGTSDFCVMKYEAKQGSNSKVVSTASGTPWVSISWYGAKEACRRSGGHLITNAEWMTIARDVEGVASNWSEGSVGSGYIYSGHNDGSPNNSLAASSDDGDGYFGTGNSSPSNQRRTLTLSNGEVIWDLAGNVWQWVDEQCDTTTWTTTSWTEWSSITGYRRDIMGPSVVFGETSGVGKYYGCLTNGNALFRGGGCYSGVSAGVFTMNFCNAPSLSTDGFGFRCVR